MPDPHDKSTRRSDTEAPQAQERAPQDGSQQQALEDEGRAGKGINQAGYLKDKDEPGAGGDPTT